MCGFAADIIHVSYSAVITKTKLLCVNSMHVKWQVKSLPEAGLHLPLHVWKGREGTGNVREGCGEEGMKVEI